jgi:hypothetical protein
LVISSMTAQPSRRLASDEMMALRFAAHRQLTRWVNKRDLQPRQQAQRKALARAVRVLEDRAFARGCELHAPDDE